MGKKLTLAILILATAGMVGCASVEDVEINESFDGLAKVHEQEQTKQVFHKTDAIARLFDFQCENENTKECGIAQTLGRVIAADKIADIKPEAFKMARPKTSLDVQEQVGIKALNGIPVVTMGVVSYKAVAEQKGNTQITADHKSDVSTTYEENHATSLAEGATATNQPNQDNSSETHEVAESESTE